MWTKIINMCNSNKTLFRIIYIHLNVWFNETHTDFDFNCHRLLISLIVTKNALFQEEYSTQFVNISGT